jgi:uncharacterized membrane protein YcaP (DUF421 family)
VFGFRVASRRTLAEMSPFDFVAVVAVGAIVGRVPNAPDTSYLAGATTLLTVLTAHAVVVRLRQFPSVARLVDHAPHLLVANGQVLEDELRRCGLTRDDLYGTLRRQGIEDLDEARYVVLEQRGQISIVRRNTEADLVRDIVERTTGQMVERAR